MTMAKSGWIGWAARLGPLPVTVFLPALAFGGNPADKASPVITITRTDCPVSQPGTKTKEITRLLLATSTFAKEGMARHGPLRVAGRTYAVDLPRARSYSLRNAAATDLRLLNTSGVIYIDQNGDGRPTPDEAWNANRPIWVADQMVDVVDLAADAIASAARPNGAGARPWKRLA